LLIQCVSCLLHTIHQCTTFSRLHVHIFNAVCTVLKAYFIITLLSLGSQHERKGKEEYLYRVFIQCLVSKHSDMDHSFTCKLHHERYNEVVVYVTGHPGELNLDSFCGWAHQILAKVFQPPAGKKTTSSAQLVIVHEKCE